MGYSSGTQRQNAARARRSSESGVRDSEIDRITVTQLQNGLLLASMVRRLKLG
jgi:hypothetical protein